MPNTVDNVYVRTFEDNIRALAQQTDTKLRGWVDEVNEGGEDHVFRTIGLAEAEEKVGRLVQTPVMDTPWGTRLVTPATYHAGDSSEQEDIRKMLTDPNSKIAVALGKAMRRKVDDVIIAAATATAYDKDATSIAFDTANQKVGDGTGVIGLDLITQVLEVFDKNDIDEDEPKVFVIGPTQKRKMLQLMEVTSVDYQSQQALTNGYLPNFLGFTWIVSNRLLVPTAGQLSCLAFTRQAIGLHVLKDIWARVAEDPSSSFAWIIYTAMTMGAVRVEDEHLVHVHLKDAMS